MTTQHAHTSYVVIWVWLVVLVGVSLVASALPGGRALVVTAIFAAAVAKASLVALHYMHLKAEPWVIYAIALVPVAFVMVLGVALLPDFSFHH